VEVPEPGFDVPPQERQALRVVWRVAAEAARDGWVVLRAEGGGAVRPVLAFRGVVRE